LATDADVQVRIYDISGTLVRQLGIGHQGAGYYVEKEQAVYWNGRDDSGERVSSGLYFYQLRAGNYSAAKRMVILK
jgi:flagellar hook assembly protein FlgD